MTLSNFEKRLRIFFTLGLVIFSATTVFEWRLRAQSPIRPIAETGQVVPLKIRGGRVYVRSMEYFLDIGGSLGGAGLCIGSLLVYAWSTTKPNK